MGSIRSGTEIVNLCVILFQESIFVPDPVISLAIEPQNKVSLICFGSFSIFSFFNFTLKKTSCFETVQSHDTESCEIFHMKLCYFPTSKICPTKIMK